MRKMWSLLVLFVVGCAGLGAAEATVVPEAERETAHAHEHAGPEDHVGVSVAAIGAVALAEVPELAEREIRVREISIAPGGHVAVHRHTDRPGFAYILSGQVFEHRSDREQPTGYGPGGVAFERDGVVHWWENRGEEPARALVVDLVPAAGD